ncbi:hypothetical protein OAE25_03270 [Verrucomicrobiales bacterium]|nr:hypothetical protein [Verrucomicrobiales bacterium]
MKIALDRCVHLNVSSPLRGAAKGGAFQARRASGDDKFCSGKKGSVKSKGTFKSQHPALQEVSKVSRACRPRHGAVGEQDLALEQVTIDFGLVNLTHRSSGLTALPTGEFGFLIWSPWQHANPAFSVRDRTARRGGIAQRQGNSLAFPGMVGLLFFKHPALRFAISRTKMFGNNACHCSTFNHILE